MKIAVTYNNGEVFQHFGHSEQFKIYEVTDGKVVSSEVVDSNGQGHGALAGVLAGEEVDVLICGGIGGGAMTALTDNGIEVCAGASGSTDEAVEAYLKGELESTGVNCDHHGEEHTCGDHSDGHSCGGHDDAEEGCGGCGDNEGGCAGCSGCHSSAPAIEGKNVGKICRAHYVGTFDDGTQFDSSYDRGEPLEFICGAGMMIHGFDAAVANMDEGETLEIHLEPSEAYGERDPEAIFTTEISELPGSEDLTVGQQVYLQDMYGRPFPVLVTDKTDSTITLDANHEMAGKALNFKIDLVAIK
ncbi:NifB/NifX family molybdenum-iron cluster-binding protein [Butyrivibrio sp. FC2001]|jgi:FKBP-type peptidyl-prolyl cis-trans isomerase 2/predicted Fe-Mo cluster-binding NifX family protein|uniref:NifB/NifX family molybdenum-iron cluster-binding protein n=1 Tax=Butyrivibrio sp. FC2001 TaxID=1280671 RepID=UPI000412042E|nr:NifB/NifX family molybdenum-iron cluster-binding protein [Butyrivibrio sp. FC2001]